MRTYLYIKYLVGPLECIKRCSFPSTMNIQDTYSKPKRKIINTNLSLVASNLRFSSIRAANWGSFPKEKDMARCRLQPLTNVELLDDFMNPKSWQMHKPCSENNCPTALQKVFFGESGYFRLIPGYFRLIPGYFRLRPPSVFFVFLGEMCFCVSVSHAVVGLSTFHHYSIYSSTIAQSTEQIFSHKRQSGSSIQ